MQIFCRLLTFSLLFQFWLELSLGKRHNLTFTDDPRRNILLSEFGYGTNATLDFVITDFMIPGDVLKRAEARSYDKLGSIGFTLSRDRRIANEISTNPHICQLEQKDQGIDALFFIFDFAANMLLVIRSGKIQNMKLCTETSSVDCHYSDDGEKRNATSPAEGTKIGGFFQNLFGSSNKKTPYLDFIPLEKTTNDHYNALFGIRFNSAQAGFYHLYFHNCFNYREHGYSDRVAVDFTVNIVERNVHSFLSVGDIPKPSTYVYTAFLFALATILWANILCKSESKHIFRVHRLMLVLVFLKTLSLFFHGINYYFVSIYGHQRELWAIIFYVTHLLKGALLFGTIILIGTGYTFFKNFLTDRDRRLFIFVLPLQILDNVAMVILEESDIGDQRYFFWLEIFVFLDLVCCMAIIWPIVWSIRHLESGARVDGKIAFNLEKLRLFRQFYVIVVAYIYLTRGSKFIIEFFFSQETRWVSVLVVELANLFFFCLVGAKFRPLKGNPYLRLTQQDGHTVESGFALTSNGLFEKITRVRQVSEDGGGLNDEMNMNNHRGEHTDEEGGDDDDTLLPKTGRDMGLLTL